MTVQRCLLVYTIYDSPTDFPGQIVVRSSAIDASGIRPSPVATCYPDLEAARHWLRHAGLSRIPRDVDDDACIVETWL